MQQTDTTPLDGNNAPENIVTAQKSDAIDTQIEQNIKDLPTAEKAIAETDADALTDEGKQNAAVVEAIISADPATSSETATPNSNSGKKSNGNKGSKNNRRDGASRWARRRSFYGSPEE